LQAKKTSGDISDDSANSLVGRKASVTSSLRPFGVVKLDGEEMAAKLMSGHADVGEEVVIVGRGAFGFLVEPVRK
jgi:membrane protein implicated in regulation of membrane protease activity